MDPVCFYFVSEICSSIGSRVRMNEIQYVDFNVFDTCVVSLCEVFCHRVVKDLVGDFTEVCAKP